MNWTREDINTIKTAMKSETNGLSEKLSNRLGVDEQSVREKIHEIELYDRIKSIARGKNAR